MSTDFRPEHIAEPQTGLPPTTKLYIISGVTFFFGLSFINSGDFFIGMIVCALGVFAFFRPVLGYHHCLLCDERAIPKSKKYCYDCWQRAQQSSNPELNKDILNPES